MIPGGVWAKVILLQFWKILQLKWSDLILNLHIYFRASLSSVVWGERGRERKQVRVWALCVLRSHPTSLIFPSLTINPSLEKWLIKNSLISLGETKGKKTVKDMYVCIQHLPYLYIYWAMQGFFQVKIDSRKSCYNLRLSFLVWAFWPKKPHVCPAETCMISGLFTKEEGTPGWESGPESGPATIPILKIRQEISLLQFPVYCLFIKGWRCFRAGLLTSVVLILWLRWFFIKEAVLCFLCV